MICPACGNELNPIQAGSVTVDICAGGCGGIWFDAFELQKMDEVGEFAPKQVLTLSRAETAHPNLTARRQCPKCEGIKLRQHFYSAERGVLVDSCPNCGGYWLDAGELEQVRAETETSRFRKQERAARLDKIALSAMSRNVSLCEEDAADNPVLARAMNAMSRTINAAAQTPPGP